MGAISRIALFVGIAAAIAGCSTPLASRDKGALNGDATRSPEQEPAPPVAAPGPSLPLRVVFASPPPVVSQAARYVWVPEWKVYILEGHDIVYSEGYHYYFYEGHWYVARSCAGPWALIASPPPTLTAVPPGHFHQRLPGGLAKQDMAPSSQLH